MAGRRLMMVVAAAAVAAFLAAAPADASGRHVGKSVRFDLLRLAPASLPELARSDRQRMVFISSRGRRRAAETTSSSAAAAASAFAMPLSSGAYTGTGQYFVRFRVGTPAQPFLLVADTGSDLTWVKCSRSAPAPDAANASLSSASPRRAFRPDKSKTWAPLPCVSDTCKASLPFSLNTCSTPGSPCAYDYRGKRKNSCIAGRAAALIRTWVHLAAVASGGARLCFASSCARWIGLYSHLCLCQDIEHFP